MINMTQTRKKEVMKAVRLEHEVAFLAEVLAAGQGKSFSQLIRERILEDVIQNLSFIKSKIETILNVFDHFEKSETDDMLRRAAIAKSLYPIEGARIEDYLWYVRAEDAAKKLCELGFEKDFAEKIAFDYFWSLPKEKALVFKKSLENISASLSREISLGQVMREARRKYFGEEGEGNE